MVFLFFSSLALSVLPSADPLGVTQGLTEAFEIIITTIEFSSPRVIVLKNGLPPHSDLKFLQENPHNPFVLKGLETIQVKMVFCA